ncbi:YbaY family lipoprotein [Romeria aff. gracilis LEGE 07310]|uniref:YbaY family lipoprotein n=1 Tax=Vasconcelosia minhoensis LEGE 07310 TaxID=915328 RepID=A0A8J7ALM8_9CYAN|nr:YbaY family lipoprotein [Romeria gracilis]MBE9077265.1 YbaY family lipoprotein [Romeria aff. gracilis LEGE 07310]
MRISFILIAIALGSLTLFSYSTLQSQAESPVETETAMATVVGTLTYSGERDLPEGAIAYITLADVSPLQDSSASILARQTITQPASNPIIFELIYRSGQINPRHLYALQAQITLDGQVIYRSRSAYPVITQGHPNRAEIRAELVD